MKDKKRWYVLRPLRLNSGAVLKPGTFLGAKHMDELVDAFPVLVRQVRLYDTKGEIDTPWNERNKHKLRLKCLEEIGTPESKAMVKTVKDRLAKGRMIEFSSPREKAIAKELSGKPEPKKAAPKKVEAKGEGEEKADKLDELLG